jgi:hypothetical protein
MTGENAVSTNANSSDPAIHLARRMVREINDNHGLRFMLRGRCQGGMQGGAWKLVDTAGRQAVLKWRDSNPGSRIPRLMDAVDRIRSAGYPTPAWIASGFTTAGSPYHLQEFVPGHPSPLTARTAALLIEVVERQAGLDPDPIADWSRYVSSQVRDDDGDGPRRFLRGLGRPGEDLLAHFDHVLDRFGSVRLPTGDMVHGDFNSCNVLTHGGRVSGVIDIEAFGSGTRAIDYGWLLREAYVEGAERDAIRMIRHAGDSVAGPGVFATCVAATAFDIVRFQALHDDPDNVPGVISRLHDLADDLSRSMCDQLNGSGS